CSYRYTQTPQHLLLSCRNYREARKKIKSSLQETRLTMSLLLDTDRGIQATLAFIQETKVGTRKWY
ncbi:uncharacterized protein M421DRAFT_12746, partial [Didymella exigua CBS 183.55]